MTREQSMNARDLADTDRLAVRWQTFSRLMLARLDALSSGDVEAYRRAVEEFEEFAEREGGKD